MNLPNDIPNFWGGGGGGGGGIKALVDKAPFKSKNLILQQYLFEKMNRNGSFIRTICNQYTKMHKNNA